MRKIVKGFAFAAATCLACGPAWAGSEVHGYGSSQLEAMREANAQAQSDARAAETCVTTRASPQTCRQNNGVWDCYAIIANHQGSC